MPVNNNQKKKSSKSLEDHGIYLLEDIVDEVSCSDAIRFVLEENLNQTHEYLELIINSPGGSLSDGFGLIDIMEGSSLPIRTIGLGTIASMGLLIFLAGEKGHRILTPNSMVLSHQYSAGFYGKEHELLSSRKSNDLASKIILNHYKKHTKLSEKQIKENLLPPSDVWLSAKECLKLGLCDAIKYI